MWHQMIERKRNEWLQAADCPISDLISYITTTNQMRDVQIDAIKTYLFLKIACDNKPLNELFASGVFNSFDFANAELTQNTRDYLINNPAASALFEYASQTNDHGQQLAPNIVNAIKNDPQSIDYQAALRNIFYGVTYTDYLFSLPMGAGKTYLMAAFIYFDLYFAQLDPDNLAFAHNFMVLVPSGLKSSVVPSLKTIANFNPEWVLPQPAATNLKRLLKFEVLDQGAAAKKSNRARNPNVQKINNHQPFEGLMGLVCVTNAEKVILDRVAEKDGTVIIFDDSDDERDKLANELRNIIGKLPQLSVFIDEAHHAAKDEIKLRAVVNKWAQVGSFNSVVGFSGTPYVERKEKIAINTDLEITNKEISNVVHYYPLVDGIDNFLKKPTVVISQGSSVQIVEAGVREFLRRYKDTTYSTAYGGQLVSKLGIYCGTIERLEEEVYPVVEHILSEQDIDPTTAILKFHRGNKIYPMPVDSQMRFDTLDTSLSKVRIVLLVQIGKEGWDCTSLTGVVLSQERDCPTNMVLQTSCRCLRQAVKGEQETALIYLNEDNGNKINAQLLAQQHISLQEFQNGTGSDTVIIERYDRTNYLNLPKLDFYQLRVDYQVDIVEDKPQTASAIAEAHNKNTMREKLTVRSREGFDIRDSASETIEQVDDTRSSGIAQNNQTADFNTWLYRIAKGSFGFVSMSDLLKYQDVLREVYEQITEIRDDKLLCFLPSVLKEDVEANIRKAFYEKRSITTIEELIPEQASLLKVENFTNEVEAAEQIAKKDFYPDQLTVGKIILDDKGELELDEKKLKDKTFHYLPYRTDSAFEQTFLEETLKLKPIADLDLEVYYNGDRSLTEFQIRCYKGHKGAWNYVGSYTPDFLIIQRHEDAIHKAVIVETKGALYAHDPRFIDRRNFMESDFIQQNNERAGYTRFEYLYLEDKLSENERIAKTLQTLDNFFKGEN